MSTPFLPGIVTLPRRNDEGVAKRARDGDLLTFLEEADARGWSSAVSERSLALRRRRGPDSSSSPRGCGWVAATSDEHGCRREEAGAPDPIGSGAAAEEAAMVDPLCFGFFWCRDLDAFDPPPMGASLLLITDPLLPPGGITILEARSDDRAAATTDEHDCSREEAATPDAVGAEAAAEETAVVDPYLSHFCLTL